MDNYLKVKSSQRFFDGIDYTIFITLLLLPTFIGVYFAYCSKKRPNTTLEYLIGDKKIGFFPITMSLVSSVVSLGSFLAMGTDIYRYGTQLFMICVAKSLACFFMGLIFAPVLYELNMISSYEYFNIRFNNTVRIFGSFLFLVKMLAYQAVNIYGSCIALAQVSGFDVKWLIPCVSIVCIFYTSIGGLRAVVWADTLQMALMFLGTFIVMVIGINQAGGIENIWKINEESGRIIFFEMNFDPSIRYNFWDVTFASTFLYLGYLLVNQSVTQRCLSLPSFQKAKIAIFILCILSMTFTILSGITALAAYTFFQDCDPITSKTISRGDQIIPYFMMTITKKIPAVPGIFISAIFSASLSSVSTGLNSMAGVILIDLIRPFWKRPISEAKETLIMKIMVVISGMVFVALVYVADMLGDIFQTIVSLQAIFQGALLGMFVLGILFPWANSTGALAGGSTAVALIAWMCIGAQVNKKRMSKFKTLLSIDGCDNSTLNDYYSFVNSTKTIGELNNNSQGEVFSLYRVPFSYYNVIGMATVVVIGMFVSFFTGPNNPKEMDSKLFAVAIRRFCKTENETTSFENIKLMKGDSEKSTDL